MHDNFGLTIMLTMCPLGLIFVIIGCFFLLRGGSKKRCRIPGEAKNQKSAFIFLGITFILVGAANIIAGVIAAQCCSGI